MREALPSAAITRLAACTSRPARAHFPRTRSASHHQTLGGWPGRQRKPAQALALEINASKQGVLGHQQAGPLGPHRLIDTEQRRGH